MIGHPKPPTKNPRGPRPLRRTTALRSSKPGSRPKRMRSSPYLHPEWLALRRRFLRERVGRSRRLCWHCQGRVGRQVHHEFYAAGRGWRRLLVTLDALTWLCAECHEAVETTKRAGTPRPTTLEQL